MLHKSFSTSHKIPAILFVMSLFTMSLFMFYISTVDVNIKDSKAAPTGPVVPLDQIIQTNEVISASPKVVNLDNLGKKK